MITVLLFGLIAAAAAAPHRYGHISGHHHSNFRHYDPFAEDIFDTKNFWMEMANEMRQIDEMMATFTKRFPTLASQNGIEGNEYKIIIPLNGFEEKDIVVKAKEGFLMVQAVHKMAEGGEKVYLDAKTLPAYVNVTGTWTFEQGILKIVFPLKDDAVEATVTTEADVTEMPVIKDREEMDNDNRDDYKDADVGLRGDENKSNDISRNTVEATTYAVDLKDEVEFVPVGRY